MIIGYRRKISFVIFLWYNLSASGAESPDPLEHLKVTPDSTNPGMAYCEGWIKMPDGTKQDLPSSKMVFEYADAVYRKSGPINMTTNEFFPVSGQCRHNPNEFAIHSRWSQGVPRKDEKRIHLASGCKRLFPATLQRAQSHTLAGEMIECLMGRSSPNRNRDRVSKSIRSPHSILICQELGKSYHIG